MLACTILDIISGAIIGYIIAWIILSLWVIIKMRELKRGKDVGLYATLDPQENQFGKDSSGGLTPKGENPSSFFGSFISPCFDSNLLTLSLSALKKVFACGGAIIILECTFAFGTQKDSCKI